MERCKVKARNRLPYLEVNRGGYGGFRGVEIAVGKRGIFRGELHLYKRDIGIGWYTNFVRMGQ